MKEEEEERTTGEEGESEEGERVNLKKEKSEARDSTEERRKTEGEGGGDSKVEVEEQIIEGGCVKAEQQQLDANNDSKTLHPDSLLLVKAEVNAALKNHF